MAEMLPPVVAPFRKGMVKRIPEGGEMVSYRIPPAGTEFQVYIAGAGNRGFSYDPGTEENRKTAEKLFDSFYTKLKDTSAGGKKKVKLLFRRPLVISALAGKKVQGVWQQYQTGGKAPFSGAGRFVTFYRGKVVWIDGLHLPAVLPPEAQQQLFSRFVTALCSSFYEGEKITVPGELRSLLISAYDKLLTVPLEAMEEAYALSAFVNADSRVIVNIIDSDLVWHKSLAKGSLKEQKYAFLLFASYMAGNAIAQVREGVCRDKRNSGLDAMKKVYGKLKEKDPAFSIPELEK
ncbi:MAG: hypothetical protein IKA79_04210 [Lentisphaeria bacterium]|nr:hypothetical protein [Lentisphaeria bacterium]